MITNNKGMCQLNQHLNSHYSTLFCKTAHMHTQRNHWVKIVFSCTWISICLAHLLFSLFQMSLRTSSAHTDFTITISGRPARSAVDIRLHWASQSTCNIKHSWMFRVIRWVRYQSHLSLCHGQPHSFKWFPGCNERSESLQDRLHLLALACVAKRNSNKFCISWGFTWRSVLLLRLTRGN